ncbi:MAG TPA: single-stranded-DNA-specific exonuclease RecJ, partial [Nitrospirae bacterium]|nr:single-stranded-DNA-specific exonuclease RecJ [Nitrospirota bacterium]
MNKRWLVNRTNQEFLEYLSGKTSISTVLAQILVNRGIKDENAIRDFLSPSLDKLHDPFLLPDMQKAVDRIKTASDKGETILVHGDYDADGITATALMVSVLRTLGLKTSYHIPNRISDGYGLNKRGIEIARSLGAGLIITVDCGITSEEEVSLANSSGIDTIITDHHEPPKQLPVAVAVINPNRADSDYPFRHLAGVGVAFKLAQALLPENALDDLLALSAIGTIADSVDLTGENRVLVTHGLKKMNAGMSKPWISSLKETAGIADKDLLSGTLSYTIVPRINAAGRLGEANEVVELFLTQNRAKADEIALFLDEQNRKRQQIEGDVYRSALEMIDPDNPDSAIVLHSSEWHQGVLGIVASRIVEMFYRPAFLFSVKGDKAKGSA